MLLISVFGRKLQYAVQAVVPSFWIGTIISVLLSFALVIWFIRYRQRLPLSRLATLGGAGIFLIAVSYNFEIPEEKLHLLLFAIWGYLSLQIFYLRVAIVMCISFAALDEGVQYFIPDRVADWRDVAFNLSAVLIGLALAHGSRVNR